ncbi:MAG: energy transducer TonB [Mariniphaga sp.]|nr:energy transducer TonB [Mariniphaga sp.]
MHKKPNTFLNLPEYPGGKEQLKKFVKEHLRYPKEALEHKIEGLVIVSAEITYKGDVINSKVEKGIGYGCDEEAIRVVNLMRFGGAKNRGVKVKARKKFRINFKLPKAPSRSLTYSIEKKKTETEKKNSRVFSYTINIDPKN